MAPAPQSHIILGMRKTDRTAIERMSTSDRAAWLKAYWDYMVACRTFESIAAPLAAVIADGEVPSPRSLTDEQAAREALLEAKERLRSANIMLNLPQRRKALSA